MSNRLELVGLDELREALRSLPKDCVEESARFVQGAANSAAATIKASYPRRTGELSDGVEVTHEHDANGAVSIVRNKVWWSYIFEHGSQTRKSRSGNPSPMPPGHNFGRAAPPARRRMIGQLIDMVRRKGLLVDDGG